MHRGLGASIDHRRRFRALIARFAALVSFSLALAVLPKFARADDDVDQFLYARDAYNSSDYAHARQMFETLLARVPPLPPILAESARKYLIATLALTQHETEAVRMLEQLLRADPDVQFSQREFSPVVLELFAQTRERLAPELQRIREQRRTQLHASEERRDAQRRLLADMLTTERVVVQIPRWTMFVPFGFGQFANGNTGLGALFAVVESLGIVTGIIGYIGFTNSPLTYTDPNGCETSAGFRGNSACPAWFATNIAGYSVAAAAAVLGIVQANLAYRPERTETRRRPVPPALQNLQIAVGRSPDGTGAGFSIGLRF